MYVENTTSSNIGYYIYTHYLGSVTARSDADGDIIQEYSYDAWGKRRDPNDWRRSDTLGLYLRPWVYRPCLSTGIFMEVEANCVCEFDKHERQGI